MAENEKKTELEKAPEKAAAKAAKAKSDKPSIWARMAAWFKSVKAECKKISWASWKSVKANTLVVLVCVIIFAIILGVLDFCFSNAVSALGDLI